MPKPIYKTGVYAIRHKISLKVYVGSAAVSIKKRWYIHKCLLRRDLHHNKHLQRAWLKYGEEAFEFIVLETCQKKMCVPREQVWMDKLRAAEQDTGYNKCPTAGSCLGVKLSEEHIAKSKKGRAWYRPTEETKLLWSKQRKGNLTEKQLEALRMGPKASVGKKRSLAVCKSISMKNKGRKRSEETKKKISLIVKAQWDAREDKRLSDSHKAAIKKALNTPGCKAKIAEARKESWKRRRQNAETSHKKCG